MVACPCRVWYVLEQWTVTSTRTWQPLTRSRDFQPSRSLPATRESLLTMLVCAFFIPSSSPPPSPPIPYFWDCMYCIRATVLYLILECFIDEFLLGVRFNTFLQLLKPLQMPDHFMPLIAGPSLSDAMYHFGLFIPLSTHTHTQHTCFLEVLYTHSLPFPFPPLFSSPPPLCLKMFACSYHRSKNS